jgi:hypothetical protein
VGEINALEARKDGVDAFLGQKLEEGYVIETRSETHAIIARRPRGLKRFTSAETQAATWLRSTNREPPRCVRQSRVADKQDVSGRG